MGLRRAASALLLALLALGWLPPPASAQTPFAQVFGPTTVDPGFTTTGEKTLLTMNTSLPSGGKNVILVAYAGYTSLAARGTFRIYKGSTLLYETKISGEYLTYTRTRPFHHLLIAVDDAPAGSDTYSFRIYVSSTGATSSATVHVQGMVVHTDQAVWGYNTAAVNIPAGDTATVTSLASTFPAGSKVVVLATVYCAAATGTGSNYLVGAGNIKLKAGDSVVSSNQFDIGSYSNIYPLRASLVYLDTPASSSQTYSVEVTNNATVAHNCYAVAAAFKVSDGASLDGGSVAVATTQTTVGSLSTSLAGDVAVIALAAAERTATGDGNTFAANAVVLQKDNSATGQVSNLLTWYMYRTSYNARSGVLPLFRYDTGVTNPSYQVKMTASGGTPNGEAKIVAFTISLNQQVARTVSELVAALDAASRSAAMSRLASEAVAITDIAQALRRLIATVLLSDSAAASDAPTRIPNYARASAELVSAADTAARQGLLRKALAELASASDSAQRLAAMARLASEAVSATDVAEALRRLIATVLLSDSASAADSPARQALLARVFAELVAALDAASRRASVTRLAADAASLSDSVLRGFGYLRLLAEAVAAGDGSSRIPAYYRALPEAMSASDLAGRVSVYVRSALDSLLADSPASRAAGILRQWVDQLSASSEAARGALYARSPAELVASGDLAGAVASLAARIVNLAESLAAGDQASPARLAVRALAEALSSLDAAGRLAGYVRGLEEGLSVVQPGSPTSPEDHAVFPIIGAYPPVETLTELVGMRDVASAVAPRVPVLRPAQMAVTLAIILAAVGAVVVVASWREERRRKEEEES